MRKEEENYEEKNVETKPIFEVAYLGTLEAISLKFGMWSAEVGGSVHSKNRLVSSRQHRATEVQIVFSFFLSIYSRVLRAGFLGRTTHYHVS